MHTWTKNRNIEKKPKQYSFTDSPENSACEEFFGKMKNEMFYGRNFVGVTIETFVEIINDYIVWYNTKRIKASLGYMSPMEYRQSLGLN